MKSSIESLPNFQKQLKSLLFVECRLTQELKEKKYLLEQCRLINRKNLIKTLNIILYKINYLMKQSCWLMKTFRFKAKVNHPASLA